jgi:predicted DNA-binding protein
MDAKETRSVTFHIRLTPAVLAGLKKVAKEQDRTVSYILNDLAKKYIEEHKDKY